MLVEHMDFLRKEFRLNTAENFTFLFNTFMHLQPDRKTNGQNIHILDGH